MLLLKRMLAHIGRILVACLVALVIAEVFLQHHQPPKLPFYNKLAPYVMFKPPPNYVWKSDGPAPSSREGRPAIAFTNGDSLRVPSSDYPLSRKKPEGQFRIAMIGGSTVHGGTTFDVTLPGALKRKLQASFPSRDIEVINGGIVSAIARQEFVFLATTLTDYNLDLLITYDGINDSGQMLHFENRVNYPYFFSALETAWNHFISGMQTPWWSVIASRSAVLRIIWPSVAEEPFWWQTVSPEVLIRDQQLRREYADAYIDSWAKIGKLCTAYGIVPVFVLQPTSLYAIFPKETDNPTKGEELFLYANYLVYEDFQAKVREFALANPDYLVLDFSILIPRLEAYLDGAHVYDEVNDEIAGAIGKAIESRIQQGISH